MICPKKEWLKVAVHIQHREKKDPRELRVLDPASGSGHFLLYCFDLLLTIYEEAYSDSDLGPALQKDYQTLEDLRRDVPRLILAHNIYGIDIDPRASQIAALALWLRCQRAYQEMGLKKDRPKINRSNFVCAEPMPGEQQMLKEFVGQIEPRLLGQLVEVIFEKMKFAGETGPLLKIEEEIRDAVTQAWKQWLAGPISVQRSLFEDTTPSVKQQQFDFTGVTDAQFFEQAEEKVVGALRAYAEKAQNGHQLQRRLFSEDAVRGFSFVDLCHKRYDVALMNPPFGSEVPAARPYIVNAYPKSKHDLCASFVERSLGLLNPNGFLGAITTRTALFVQTFSQWRSAILEKRQFSVVGDLGYGVLDAMVETAMYVIASAPPSIRSDTAFLTALTDQDKQVAITSAIVRGTVIFRSQECFRHIPGRPMAYWVPESLLGYFRTHASFLKRGGLIKVGVQSGDDFRFFRLRWEVPIDATNTNAPTHDPHFQTSTWLPLAKGGEYSPWWDDLHLVVDWKGNGDGIKNHPSARPQNVEFFFRPGLTYPYRTTSGFGLRALPSGCGFSVGGWGVFPPQSYTQQEVFAVYNTRIARYFMEVLLGQGDSSVAGSAARNHGAESVGGIPFPSSFQSGALANDVNRICGVWREMVMDETCAFFLRPKLCQSDSKTLRNAAMEAWNLKCEAWKQVGELTYKLDRVVRSAYGINETDGRAIAEEEGLHPCDYPSGGASPNEIVDLYLLQTDELTALVQKERGSKRYVVKKAYAIDRHVDLICHLLGIGPQQVIDSLATIMPDRLPELRDWCSELVSYAVGCTFGRWDIRHALRIEKHSHIFDPFESLPKCPPGALKDRDDAPALHSPKGYPIQVAWDGILVDDTSNGEHVSKRVQDVLEFIWKDHGDAVEKEACEILGVASLRDYFQVASKGGFWNDHISLYSKSRRNAPIYWLLQSSKKNYSLWLYYHRLDKDLLFKALVNYVEPKIRLETSRLDALRSQKVVSGRIEQGGQAARQGT